MDTLTENWTTSRGQDTYGYNLCTLTDTRTGKRYRTCGGGYDMAGTVFGNWLADVHQTALLALVASRSADLVDCGYQVSGYRKLPDLYGLTVRPDGRVELDGACGLRCMEDIAKAIGLTVEQFGQRTRRNGWSRLGFNVH